MFAPAAGGFLGAKVGATIAGIGFNAAVSTAVGSIGTSLILGGIAQMQFHPRRLLTRLGQVKVCKTFKGCNRFLLVLSNVAQQGGPVPDRSWSRLRWQCGDFRWSGRRAMIVIRGTGGGGGGGKGAGSSGGGGSSRGTPTEDADTLQSVQFARVLDLISEGEIEGIEGGQKGVFLDGTPVQDSNGNNNFTGYSFDTRNGTQSQSYIPDSLGPQSEKAVGVEVVKATPVVRTITDTDVDRVRVTIQIPQLQVVEEDGDIRGTTVKYKIQVQYNGGGYNQVISPVIKGKSSSSYQRDHI